MAIPSINVLSLCSGTGGLDLGLRLAVGCTRTVCYVEREVYAAATLATRIAEGCLDDAPIWSDLKTFSGEPWRGIVDCVTGGYPCQPFSTAGRRGGASDPRHLWPDIARIVGEVRPGLCFFENVSGHLSLGFGAVAGDLESLGYTVAAGLFTAAEIGAPHKRERLFILAVADAEGIGSERKWECATKIAGREHGLERSSEKLANAAAKRPQGQLPTRPIQGIANGTGQPVGHASGTRPPGRQGERRDAEPQQPAAERASCLPVYPPGPADAAAWRAVLDRCPCLAPALSNLDDADAIGCEGSDGRHGGSARNGSLTSPGHPRSGEETQPAVRRLADGTPAGMEHRNHALRAAGNGVVAQCVAAAFVQLLATVMEAAHAT